MTTADSTKRYHDQCHEFFEKTAPEKARETGFVKNSSPLQGKLFLLTMVVTAFTQGTLALPDLAVNAHRLDPSVRVTGQAFKKRYTVVAVQWLQAMLVAALRLSVPTAACDVVPLLQGFCAVKLLDSSVVPLPATMKKEYPGCGGVGAQAALKLYLVLDWLTGQYETLQIETGRKADQNMGEPFLSGCQPGTLWLFDLGFFKVAFLAAIAQAKSYFLCRLQSQVQLWCRNAQGQVEQLDLDRLLHYAPPELFEIDVLVGPQQVAARLIAAPVPRDQAGERRRRVRQNAKKHGRTATPKSLARCDWTLLLTNVLASQLPTSTVLAVYAVRWQVELAFKLFKSDLHLDETSATEPHRIKCEFYAKLIALLLFNRLTGVAEILLGEKISPTKLFRRMRGDLDGWRRTLGQGRAAATREWLAFLAGYLKPSLRKAQSTLLRLKALTGTALQRKLLDPLGFLQAKLKNAAIRGAAFQQRLRVQHLSFQADGGGFQRTTATELP
jgi:hypothetical protein